MSISNFPSFTKTVHHSVYPAIDPTSPALSAQGKVVIITGGGRGVGRYIACSFAQAGAHAIIITGRTASALEDAEQEIITTSNAAGHDTKVQSFVVDVCNAAAMNQAFDTTTEQFGSIDILICNAGDLTMGSVRDGDAEAMWKCFEINVKGTLNTVQAFLQQNKDKKASKARTIIHLSTIGAHLPPFPPLAAYTSAKLAATSTMANLNAEVGDEVRVFSIHPGMLETEMSQKAGMPAIDDKGLPGAFCTWLAASAEADFLRGRLVHCNWDVEELVQKREEIVNGDLLTMRLAGWGT